VSEARDGADKVHSYNSQYFNSCAENGANSSRRQWLVSTNIARILSNSLYWRSSLTRKLTLHGSISSHNQVRTPDGRFAAAGRAFDNHRRAPDHGLGGWFAHHF